MNDLAWTVGDVELVLCPERAAFRPERGELLVADVHLGKAAAFREAGRPLPRGTTRHELRRIDALVQRKRARRVVFLGDLFHASVAADSPTAEAFRDWLGRAAVELVLVRGNHDRHASALLDTLALDVVDEPQEAGGLVYRHHPAPGERPFVAGHLHPGVRLDGARMPVFWRAPDGLVLPAFGAFTGVHEVPAAPGDRLAAATPTGVVELPLGLLS